MNIPVASESPSERAIGPAELLDRLAQKMRAESGIDLPHDYFLAEVRRQLAHPEEPHPAGKGDDVQSSACFNCWAMPEDELKAAGGR
ncbi:hypothetical protein LXM94_16920 [Rhizobium sp. TRM95111]|uniref:hypothetical protein n=1 Tax=Rhizobium alarense TaxID=2846851 RepID=UPI001F20063C|nr:hypothetical protein [Rhizobium alarense]MCF3641657.1 hypothetical protein [Rhizobium alarense]